METEALSILHFLCGHQVAVGFARRRPCKGERQARVELDHAADDLLWPAESPAEAGLFSDNLGAARKGPMLDFNQGAMGVDMV